MKLPTHLYSRFLVSRIFHCSSPFCESCLIPNKKIQFEFVIHKWKVGLFTYNNLIYLYFPGNVFPKIPHGTESALPEDILSCNSLFDFRELDEN